jgi:excisionase family DNA binding protein
MLPTPGPDDDLLRPREVAGLMGVRPTTIARWAREGLLKAVLTPGGHRRYRRTEIYDLLKAAGADPEQETMEEDAARLYDQGWTIRQVAEKFDCSYGRMRLILRKRTSLRNRGTPMCEIFESGD